MLGPREFKPPAHAQFVGPGADEVGATAFAEKQAERAEKEGFARSGFAGPGAEARVQFDPHVFDQGEVLDGQFAQHAGMVRRLTGRVKPSCKVARHSL